jgi:hypothetical protein
MLLSTPLSLFCRFMLFFSAYRRSILFHISQPLLFV